MQAAVSRAPEQKSPHRRCGLSCCTYLCASMAYWTV